MKKTMAIALASAAVTAALAACSSQPAEEPEQAPAPLVEKVLDVPGFADFLTVDGDTVWATNAGRVEQWGVDGKIAATEMPRPCGTMALAADSLWVANCPDANLYRISTKDAKVQTIIETGIANPKGETNVVAGDGSIWVPSDAKGVISRIDPATDKVIATVEVDPGTFYLSYGLGALWAVSSDEQSLQKIDPATNAVVGKVALGKQPGFLTAGEGAVWVQEQGDGTVARVDPETLEVSGRVPVGENLIYGDIDTGGGSVWLRTTDDQVFAIIDPETMEVSDRFGEAAGSGAIRYTPAGIWTSAHDNHTLSFWSREAPSQD